MKLSVISFTEEGSRKNLELVGKLNRAGGQAASYSWHKYALPGKMLPFKSMEVLLADLWNCQEGFIFIGTAGAVVRLIAPFLQGPEEDPLILVLDEEGNFVISLLSGQLRAANALCRQIGELMGAEPVITEAADLHREFSVDKFAAANKLRVMDLNSIRQISRSLLAGKRIGFYSEYPIEGQLPENLVETYEEKDEKHPETGLGILKTRKGDALPACGIVISDGAMPVRFSTQCTLVPKDLVLIMRGEAGKKLRFLHQLVTEAFVVNELCPLRACRLWIEKTEEGPSAFISQLAKDYGIELVCYSKEKLDHFEEVAEAGGCMMGKKIEKEGTELALYRRKVRIEF